MPEIIHTFTSGRMNKDLDERLVPNGEYRDAVNLEVSTSDGSDVGALQNIRGNASKLYKSFNPTTNTYTSWTTGFIDSLVNPIKIGEIKDNVNETIYWFIASDNVSVIAEYDQKTQVVSPVLVDTNSILNFSEDYKITGINIIEGLLFWTDNQTEPKVINIKEFKKANDGSDFVTHSKYSGADSGLSRDFIEADIRVIKKAPTDPLVLELARTRAVDANGNPAIVEGFASQNFVIDDPNNAGERISAPIGTQYTISWQSNPPPFYSVGDVLIFTGSAEDLSTNKTNDYEVRAEVINVSDGPVQNNVTISILSTPEVLLDTAITWDVILQEDPFFEFKFPRFAYRYKYKDGYYSSFSTFSEVAFLPGEFDYEPKKGYNLGMTNHMKQCVIKNFVSANTPIDVAEIDLLYKETNNLNVYVVDTFKRGSDIWNANEFSIKSEIISSVLPSNQLLRVYDNVPRRAKAQEITGNRLIYGNYLQNFNLVDELNNEVSPSLDITITHNTDWDRIYDDQGNDTGNRKYTANGEYLPDTPYKSIKTQRTYQLGVVFQDDPGRQTPVFTSESAATTLQKKSAVNYNRITAQAKGNKPKDFTHFRYYIKETSNEYYNLAMDRFYDAADGNIWVSFSSSDRNKVDEQTFLELKKRHDSSEAVLESAKYKIVAISNEAPSFIKETISKIGTVSEADAIDPTEKPEVDKQTFRIKKVLLDNNSAKAITEPSNAAKTRLVRFGNAGNRTNYYKITSITTQNISGTDWYSIDVENFFSDDVKWMTDGNGDLVSGISVDFSVKDSENKPEFEGRFFVKLYKDASLQEYLTKVTEEQKYRIAQSFNIGWTNVPMLRDDILSTNWRAGFFVDGGPVAYAPYGKSAVGNGGFSIGGQELILGFAGIWPEGPDFGVGKRVYREYKKAVDILESVGGLFRFKEDPDGIIYKIKEVEPVERFRNYVSSSSSSRFNDGSNKRKRWYLKVEPLDPANGTGLFQGPSGWSFPTVTGYYGWQDAAAPTIEFLSVADEDSTFSSTNPAIFETEPKESAELEVFHSASRIYPISEYGNVHKLDWFNCYSFGNGVESDRIRDDFNAVTIDNGPIVSATLKEPYNEERRLTGLIFSQIFNSVSGVNDLNQFIQAESITKDLNPIYSSIQKLHSRDTNLVVLCEDKCLRVLANKDALFNADGNTNVTSNNAVLGQAIPYVGEFGISKNPESFASYGYRVYFSDKNRGVVLRLSNDGLEEISRYGMRSFFADNLKESKSIWGSYDDDKGSYNLSLDNLSNKWSERLDDAIVLSPGSTAVINPSSTVVSFKESVNGWESRKTFSKEGGITLNDIYYTFNEGIMWEHGVDTVPYNNFYGVQYDSAVNILINEGPTVVKKYKSLNYTGSQSREYVYSNGVFTDISLAEAVELQLQNLTSVDLSKSGWHTSYIKTDLQEGYIKQFLNKENKWFQYIKGVPTYFNSNEDNNIDSREFSVQGIGRASEITAPPVTLFDLNIFNSNNPTNYTVTSENFKVAGGTDLSNLGSQTLVIKPNDGYSVDFHDFLLGTTPGIINILFTQSGDDVVLTFDFAPGTIMPNSNTDYAIDIQGNATLSPFTLQGNYSITASNATPVSETGSYGGLLTPSVTYPILTKTVTADNGFYFFKEPKLSIAIGNKDNYTIATDKTYDGNQNLTAVQFSISYTAPSEEVIGDSIVIEAEAIAIPVVSQVINAFTLNNTSSYNYNANIFGETLELKLIGVPGSVYSVELVDTSLNTVTYASNATLGSTGVAIIPSILIDDFLSNKDPYELNITGDINPSLANNGSGITIDIQQGQANITFRAESNNPELTVTGSPESLVLVPNTEYDPGSEPVLSFSFQATSASDNIVVDNAVTASSFTPVVPDPGATGWVYTIQNIAASLNNPDNDTYIVSGDVVISSTGNSPVTHVLNLDNILNTPANPFYDIALPVTDCSAQDSTAISIETVTNVNIGTQLFTSPGTPISAGEYKLATALTPGNTYNTGSISTTLFRATVDGTGTITNITQC